MGRLAGGGQAGGVGGRASSGGWGKGSSARARGVVRHTRPARGKKKKSAGGGHENECGGPSQSKSKSASRAPAFEPRVMRPRFRFRSAALPIKAEANASAERGPRAGKSKRKKFLDRTFPVGKRREIDRGKKRCVRAAGASGGGGAAAPHAARRALRGVPWRRRAPLRGLSTSSCSAPPATRCVPAVRARPCAAAANATARAGGMKPPLAQAAADARARTGIPAGSPRRRVPREDVRVADGRCDCAACWFRRGAAGAVALGNRRAVARAARGGASVARR